MKTTKAQLEAVARYDKKNTKQLHVKLNKNTDADLIEALEAVESKQGLIKQLLREYFRKM